VEAWSTSVSYHIAAKSVKLSLPPAKKRMLDAQNSIGEIVQRL